jgi:hypothetical protein
VDHTVLSIEDLQGSSQEDLSVISSETESSGNPLGSWVYCAAASAPKVDVEAY